MDPLFKKAVFMAIREGRIHSISDVSEEKSERDGRYLVLRDNAGNIIVKDFAVRIDNSDAPTSLETTQDKAIAWAYTMGYDVPTKMGGCSQGCLILIALSVFVIPGVILLVWLMVKNNQYERDMAALVSKWIDAGRPEPGEGIKEETKLISIEESTETSTVPVSTEARLQELLTMKEKGLISDDEYDTLRRKALGL